MPSFRPRLERSRSDRYVGGVCGGLARLFDIDPVIVRIVILCLAFFGAGLLVYAVAWAFIPDEGQPRSLAQVARYGGRPSREMIFIGGAVLLGLAGLGSDGDNDFGWIFLPLLVIGFFWWRREDRRRSGSAGLSSGWPAQPPSGPSGWPAQPNQPPLAPPAPSEFWAATATSPASGPPSAPYAMAPTVPIWGYQAYPTGPPRQRSHLGLITISVLVLAIGAAALLDTNGGLSLSPQGVLAGSLILVGAGLVAGAWYGRSRGLIALGLFLTLLVSTVAAVDIPWKGVSGEVRWKASTAAELDRGFHLRAGEAVLDLRELQLGEDVRTVDVTAGLGGVDVLVPRGIVTRVTGHMSLGGAEIFGIKHEGADIDVDVAQPGTPQLTINFRLGLGEIKVRHEAS